MISAMHGLYDDRIYWKEALSLKKNGYEVIHIGVGNEYTDIVSAENIRLIKIKRKHYLADPYLDKLFRLLFICDSVYDDIFSIAAGINADVYHFHDLQINRIGKKLKGLPHKPKVIYDVHEPYPVTIANAHASNFIIRLINRIYGQFIHKWELKCAGEYDLIITTEENVYNKFAGHLKRNNVEVIYNYTDHNADADPDSLSYKDKIYDAIYCGGIKTNRYAYQIIEAVRVAKSRSRDIRVLFIGPVTDPGLKSGLLRKIRSYGLEDNVFLHDPVPYNQIGEYYRKSRIGLAVFLDNPVHNIILPIKIFEYMAFGLPVVCSDFGHLARYTRINKTGITLDPSDPEAICNAILELKDDRKKYEVFSRNGIQAVKEKYSWKYMEQKLLKIYRDLLETEHYDNR